MKQTIIVSTIAGLLLASAGVAFAQITTSVGANVTTQIGNPTTKPTFDVACVQNAVEKRDTTIISAFGTFSTSITTALTTRKDALKAAWGIANGKERRAARAAAWQAFYKSSRDAHTTLKTVRNGAWKTYRADLVTCKAGDAGEVIADVSAATSL